MAQESEKLRMRRLHHQEIEAQKARERREINKVWMWVGVTILVLILLYWVFFIAIGYGPNQ